VVAADALLLVAVVEDVVVLAPVEPPSSSSSLHASREKGTRANTVAMTKNRFNLLLLPAVNLYKSPLF
jgi:hypothetical protein